MEFDKPECFDAFFDGTWSFGTSKLVSLMGEWYLHIPMTKEVEGVDPDAGYAHIIGIDRGLRFLATTYDETGKTTFFSSEKIMAKRKSFVDVRAELQSKGKNQQGVR